MLNLLDAQASAIDWERLLRRVDQDAPLLAGAMSVFAWLAPDRAATIPSAVWQQLGVRPLLEPGTPDALQYRASLLESRPWFTRLSR